MLVKSARKKGLANPATFLIISPQSVGNAVACAAASATLDVFQDEDILANATRQGDRMMRRLRSMADDKCLGIKDVRGLGLMIGVEFDDAIVPKGTATSVANACIDKSECFALLHREYACTCSIRAHFVSMYIRIVYIHVQFCICLC